MFSRSSCGIAVGTEEDIVAGWTSPPAGGSPRYIPHNIRTAISCSTSWLLTWSMSADAWWRKHDLPMVLIMWCTSASPTMASCFLYITLCRDRNFVSLSTPVAWKQPMAEGPGRWAFRLFWSSVTDLKYIAYAPCIASLTSILGAMLDCPCRSSWSS